SSWTQFMMAESALTLNTTGDAAVYLEEGMRQALGKVRSFSPSNMTDVQIDDYVAEVLAEYVAATDAEKLDIIIREWYISSFTSGMLPYNNYRRTGYPSFLQSPVIAAGAFVRSYFLPESELNSNSNEDFNSQKQVTDQVFWDTNPAGFIN
ncbi:MAG: SusD/RagB family nutrient-binding outer membrane lipoprotein, partial [Cytophagia bacterium]|nr:SusD/RagB family nutrient-binding outer membrane lipoprotein [Cytophagia bacterium]